MADNDFITGMLAGQNDNDGFGGGGWLGAVIILAIIFGWGNGGYGFGGGGGNNFESAVQRGFDTNSIITKLNGLENGLCDLGYAQNTNTLNGFSGVQNTLAQGFAGLNTALVTQGYETRMGTQATQNQLASCCCDIKSGMADLKYTMATDTCALKTQMATSTRDIIDSQNAGFRAVLDDLCKMRIEAKDEKIAEQAQRISALELAASQSNQNAYLIDKLSPKPPVAAFSVPAPWQYGGCGCNQNTCC